MTTVTVKIYNQNHTLVNEMTLTVATTDVPALLKRIAYSASKRNQYITSQLS